MAETTQSSTSMQAIIDPVDKQVLCNEIDSLRSEYLIHTRKHLEVFITPYAQIPNIIREIGRLRETTFRSIGEGTGNALDIDKYDHHYSNLFIWDRQTECIIGGYRLGLGREIFDRLGAEGFYINSLFDIDSKFNPILKTSLEMGRSYIIPSYQKNPFALLLLWRGIQILLEREGGYNYLIGPVSISKFYSGVSKSMIIAFVKRYFYDHDIAQLIKPKTPYKPPVADQETDKMLDQFGPSLRDLESFLSEIEPDHIKVPDMLKTYTRQNAKLVAFNLDPNFSDALDGLMILDLSNMPQKTLNMLQKKGRA